MTRNDGTDDRRGDDARLALAALGGIATLFAITALTFREAPAVRTSDGGSVALPARVHTPDGAAYLLEDADAQGLRVLVRQSDGCRFATVPGRRAVALDDGCGAAPTPTPKGS